MTVVRQYRARFLAVGPVPPERPPAAPTFLRFTRQQIDLRHHRDPRTRRARMTTPHRARTRRTP